MDIVKWATRLTNRQPSTNQDLSGMTGFDELEIHLTCQVAMHPRMPLIFQVVTCQTVTWQVVTCHISMTPAGSSELPARMRSTFAESQPVGAGSENR